MSLFSLSCFSFPVYSFHNCFWIACRADDVCLNDCPPDFPLNAQILDYPVWNPMWKAEYASRMSSSEDEIKAWFMPKANVLISVDSWWNKHSEIWRPVAVSAMARRCNSPFEARCHGLPFIRITSKVKIHKNAFYFEVFNALIFKISNPGHTRTRNFLSHLVTVHFSTIRLLLKASAQLDNFGRSMLSVIIRYSLYTIYTWFVTEYVSA